MTDTQAALDFIRVYEIELRTLIPAYLARVRAELACLDGFPANDGDPKVTHTSELTSVEAAVHQRMKLTTDPDDIDDRLDATVSVLRAILRDVRQALAEPVIVPRCSSTGRDGAIEWGDPLCWNMPSRGALCDRCSKREWRWRVERGLPPRTNGVFSGGDAA